MMSVVSFNSVTSLSRNLLQCPWRNTELESEVEFVQKIIHTVRSARSDYNLPNKAKTEGTV
jgi:valyl-tRNA synthetase